MKILFNASALVMMLFGSVSASAACYCDQSRHGGWILSCDHTSMKNYFETEGDCKEAGNISSNLNSGNSDCYCANSTLWCDGKLRARFNSDRQCHATLSDLSN